MFPSRSFFSVVSPVVAAMDGGGDGGEGDGGGGGGMTMPRRSGLHSDLLLEVESLEPQQLMSVRA